MLPLWAPDVYEYTTGKAGWANLWKIIPPLHGLLQSPAQHFDRSGTCALIRQVHEGNHIGFVWNQKCDVLYAKAVHFGCNLSLARRCFFCTAPLLQQRADKEDCPQLVPRVRASAYSLFAVPLVVPYPTYYHAMSDTNIDAHLTAVRLSSRTSLVAYMAGNHGRQVSLRAQLAQQCESHHPECIHVRDPTDHHNATNQVQPSKVNVTLIHESYARSIFCLQPGGDSFTRQGIFDALQCGCIPVFFATCPYAGHERAYYPFVPAFNRTEFGAGDWAVMLNSSDVSARPHSWFESLEGISAEKRENMQANIRTFLPRTQYARPMARLRRYTDATAVIRERWAQYAAYT